MIKKINAVIKLTHKHKLNKVGVPIFV